MRFLTLLLLIPILAYGLPGQVLDGNPEHVVRVALNPNSDVIYSGGMDKQLSRMGDAAAVAITKVLAGEPLKAATIDRVLLIIQMAFSAPQIVENESDREPRTALFVLRSLERQTSNAKQKKQISEVRQELQGRTGRWAP